LCIAKYSAAADENQEIRKFTYAIKNVGSFAASGAADARKRLPQNRDLV
jgi:hypothetical protein